MKKSIILLVLLVLGFSYSFSQTKVDEYNYCKKGYWNSFTNGYPQRNDIKLFELKTEDLDGNKVQFMYFERTDKTIACYVYFIQYKKEKNKKNQVLIIPDPKSDNSIIEEYYKDINQLDNEDKLYFIAGVGKIIKF